MDAVSNVETETGITRISGKILVVENARSLAAVAKNPD
jgi:hypothetical protein